MPMWDFSTHPIFGRSESARTREDGSQQAEPRFRYRIDELLAMGVEERKTVCASNPIDAAIWEQRSPLVD